MSLSVSIQPSKSATAGAGFIRGYPGLKLPNDAVSAVGNAYIGYPSDAQNGPSPIMQPKERVLVKAEIPITLTDIGSQPYSHSPHDRAEASGLRYIDFPFSIEIPSTEISRLPPALPLTIHGPISPPQTAANSFFLFGGAAKESSAPCETGIVYTLKADARFTGILENTELSDHIMLPFPSFKESNIVACLKPEFGSTSPHHKCVKRSGKWPDAPADVLGWTFEMDSHQEDIAVACSGDRKSIRFKVDRNVPAHSVGSRTTSTTTHESSSVIPPLFATPVFAEPEAMELSPTTQAQPLASISHANQHIQESSSGTRSFSLAAVISSTSTRESAEALNLVPVKRNSSNSVSAGPRASLRTFSEPSVSTAFSVTEATQFVQPGVPEIPAEFASPTSKENTGKTSVAERVDLLADGHASISVILVESWFWGDIQKGGSREVTLFELSEGSNVVFSRGERVEIRLPETLLPTVKTTNLSTTHKLLVRFVYHNRATATPNICTAEINFRVAAFSRRDLNALISLGESKQTPAIRAILPPGFCDRKKAEGLRKESIDTLRNAHFKSNTTASFTSNSSVPHWMAGLGGGGVGATGKSRSDEITSPTLTNGFGVLNHTRPSAEAIGETVAAARKNFVHFSEGSLSPSPVASSSSESLGAGKFQSKIRAIGQFSLFGNRAKKDGR
ncbi:hypothetical protein HDU78_009498 [Chytriomyces hyalinus]|nr:hypothetical protein HDU78_009498 [Chytriomyces hyalinus]